jgi:hypothetical protein
VEGDLSPLGGLPEIVEIDVHECTLLTGSLVCLESCALLDVVNVLNTGIKNDGDLGNATVHAI